MVDVAARIFEFFHYNFVEAGYNWINTPTYGLILGLSVFYLIIPLLKRFEVKVDEYFAVSLLGFIFFGGSARELVDQGYGFYPGYVDYPGNFWLVAPGIFFSMFVLTIAVLFLALMVQRYLKIRYYWTMVIVGWGLFSYNTYLIFSHVQQWWPLAYIAGFLTLSLVFLWALMQVKRFDFLRFEYNYLIVAGHLLDASATFVGIDFLGFAEKHVLPTALIELTGTAAVMYPLKLLFLIPALYIIDRDLKDDAFSRRIIKLVILIIGAGPGIRDATLTVLG
ncbi:MAG: DUF63 family protein [Candidatus Altiarchaeota archaeon]